MRRTESKRSVIAALLTAGAVALGVVVAPCVTTGTEAVVIDKS